MWDSTFLCTLATVLYQVPNVCMYVCHPKGKTRIQFLQHINSIDPYTQFTQERPDTEVSFPFLDILVSPGADNTLPTTVYRTLIPTDQSLYWESHHDLLAKYSVFNTLTHWARTICAKPQLLHKEEEQVRKAIIRTKYPRWALNRLQTKNNHRYSNTQAHTSTNNTNSN